MEQEKGKDNIQENLYSRQMAVYGEAMGKLIQMKVFLYGLRGVYNFLKLFKVNFEPKRLV